jgi:hypothetical protein
MSELKKCPFCGGEACTCYNATEKYWKVTCLWCGIAVVPQYPDVKTMPSFKTKEEAINAWNTRKPVDDVMEALEEIIKKEEKIFNLFKKGTFSHERACHKLTAYNIAIQIVKEILNE